ncbi:MAG: T9SS type A sorting domain-containing protein [Bacteroidia bacterium]|nr:T9SS type A sorting domain-containing protein [Bacteroidia bacterium]
MKYPILSFGILLSAAAIAQPTFNRSDMFPAGTAYQKTMVSPDEINTDSTGPNSVWNFPLTPLMSSEEIAAPLGTQGPYETFQTSTYVFGGMAGTDSIYNYYEVNDNAFAHNGFFQFSFDGFPPPPGANGPMIYNPPVDVFRFPSTMGSTFNQEIHGVRIMLPDTIVRTGTEQVMFDGYGTLTTPAGTYENVLRFFTIKEFKDSSHIDGNFNYKLIHSWSWISPGTRGVTLLYIEKDVTDLGTVNLGAVQGTAWYTNPGDVGFADIPNRSFTIYPNPMQDIFNLSGKAENGNMTVDLLSVTGQHVQRLYTGNLNGQQFNLQLSLKNVSPGFYLVNVLNGQKVESYPVVIK